MARFELLFVVVVVLIPLGWAEDAIETDEGRGAGIVLEGSTETPGHAGDPGALSHEKGDWTPPPRPSCRDGGAVEHCRAPQPELVESDPDPGTPPLTIEDVARFLPGTDAITIEPNGWGVVGLPTNIHADRITRVVDGELLGSPVQVAFDPIAFAWDYGDTTTRQTTTPGASWAELGLAEFAETPTSHNYATRGTYTVTLSATVTARYRIDAGPWTSIAGTATLPPATAPIRIVEADTVLVDRDCNQNPDGPGC